MAHLRNQPRAGVTRRATQSSSRDKGKEAGAGRKLLRLVVLSVLAGAGWIGWEHLPSRGDAPLFPIAYVRIQGEIENLDVSKLREALRPVVNGGYFSQDMGGVEGVVRSFAWIDKVRLARVWPDTLEITLNEQKAVARWGDKALLNPQGQRFAPGGIEAFAHLPVIYGPSGMEGRLLETLSTLNEGLRPQGMTVASLDLSQRRAWIVKLDSGLELHCGRQDPVKLLDRFLKWVPKLGEGSLARLKRVDLRYPNGFAVVWKSDAEMGIGVEGENGGELQLNGMVGNLALEK